MKDKDEKIINSLLNEALSGQTKMDTLEDNTKYPFIDEFDAYYFKSMRNFFETSMAHRVVEKDQDLREIGHLNKIKRKII